MSALQDISVDLEAERTAEISYVETSETGSKFSRWFNSLTIGKKIQAFFAWNLLFALVGAVVVVSGYFQLWERGEFQANADDRALAAEQLVGELSEARRNSELLIATGQIDLRSEALTAITTAEQKANDLRNEIGAANTEAFDRLSYVSEAIADFRRQATAFDPAGLSAAQRSAVGAELAATGNAAKQGALEVADLLEADAKSASEGGSSLVTNLAIAITILTVVLAATTIFSMRFFDRRVGGSLAELSHQMTKLSRGDRDIEIAGTERQDEIGAMARAMEVFYRAARRLERMNKERAEHAKAEMEAQARAQEETEAERLKRNEVLKELANQFERTVGDVVSGVAAASTELQATSKAMASTAEETSRQTGEVARSMEEANSGATAAAAASDEFAMSIGEISRQAASSAELARKATESASEADATISALSDSAEQVGQIVELIQTIAQRTNLLALNASIEAARGGEAGRGFAVVASEVKELAMQTSRATEQVAEQIRAMQDTTGASVSALRSIAGQVQQLESTAVSIASAVDQQSVAGQDLARSIDLAARGTERVAGHISDVRELSMSTGAAASQVLASATELEVQAADLRSHVDRFLNEVRAS